MEVPKGDREGLTVPAGEDTASLGGPGRAAADVATSNRPGGVRLGPGDLQRVVGVLFHPDVINAWFDDTSVVPDVETLREALGNESVYFLQPLPGTLFIVERLQSVCYEGHFAALPHARGRVILEATRLALCWLFANVPCCRKVVGFVPAYHKHGLVMARAAGFVREGRIGGAFLKRGQLHDLVVLGVDPADVARTIRERRHS